LRYFSNLGRFRKPSSFK